MSDELAAKLDTLIRLQAYLAISGLSSQREKIEFLARAGLGPKAIAEILGTTPNTVNVALSAARKAGTIKGSQRKFAKGEDRDNGDE